MTEPQPKRQKPSNTHGRNVIRSRGDGNRHRRQQRRWSGQVGAVVIVDSQAQHCGRLAN